jgi:DNA-binding GntR family transcriptional regulator
MPVTPRDSTAGEILNNIGLRQAASLPERVYETLEQSIVDGILRPEVHLVEDARRCSA